MSDVLEAEQTKVFAQLFTRIYQGNQECITLAFSLLRVLHVWDDLIDKDKELSDADISEAFLNALTTIGGSRYWDTEMAALLKSVYLRWQTANIYEHSNASTDNTLSKAWMLRAGCYDLFVLLASKAYGVAWAEQVAPMVYDAYGETLKAFLKEVKNA